MAVWLLVWAGAVRADDPAARPHRTDRLLVKPRAQVFAAHAQSVQSVHIATGAEVLREYPALGGLQVLKLPPEVSVEKAMADYQQSGLFEYAEPDYIVQIDAEPNDPAYVSGRLWGLHNTGQDGGTSDADIDAPEAWEFRTSAPDIIVAVIDSGVRYTHEDLAANMWRNPHEIPGNGIDDDGNGYIDDVYGINAITGSGDPMDDNDHGTHCAGTIGAVGNNSLGIVGVAWKVQIMACKFLDWDGYGVISDAIECVDYARRMGAHIMNNSWGGTGYSSAMRDAIVAARDAGIIFVAAAGNSGTNNDVTPHYPSSYDVENVVAVAATNRRDELATRAYTGSWASNYGTNSVHLAAPGVDIYSAVSSGDSAYAPFGGTSMAAPHVAGALALLKAQFPYFSYQQLIDRLLSTVDEIPELADRVATGGRLNLARALQPICALTTLQFNQVASGGLVDTDCRSPHQGNSYYADLYTFNATSGRQVIIEVTSTAFDPYVYLIGPSGIVLAEDDDGGEGSNARIPATTGTFTLPSNGKYTIEVTSADAGATGAYRISLKAGGLCAAPAPTTGTASPIGLTTATLNGTVKPNGCSTTVFYQFGLTPNFGRTTASRILSGTLDETPVAAKIKNLLAYRTYYYRLVAKNAEGTRYGETKTFMTVPGESSCVTFPLSLGMFISQTLTPTDCASIYRGAGYFADRYTFYGLAGQMVAIELSSFYFDTYLFLVGPSGGVLLFNDDSGNSLNSRIPENTGYFKLPVSGTYTLEVTSFLPGATGPYYLRLLRGNGLGCVEAPTVTAAAATGIGSTVATLNGFVNPNLCSTTVFYQWGTTTSYGKTTASTILPSGKETTLVPMALTGLQPNTTYHYRLVANNSAGVRYGADTTFTTLPGTSPTTGVSTGPAANITARGATLTGTMLPGSSSITVFFQYGTTTQYGRTTASKIIPASTLTTTVSIPITSLLPDTVYHFRMVGNNGGKILTGGDQTFRTLEE